VKQSALYIALLPLLFTPAIYAETVALSRVLDNRAAQGDITQPAADRQEKNVCRVVFSAARTRLTVIIHRRIVL